MQMLAQFTGCGQCGHTVQFQLPSGLPSGSGGHVVDCPEEALSLLWHERALGPSFCVNKSSPDGRRAWRLP